MSSCEWDRFGKQQTAEREQLRRLLTSMKPLLAKCHETAPTEIELAALATLLHSFYTGVENIFKRVAVELDSKPPQGEAWHRELLRQMTGAKEKRPALLSTALHDRLLEYLRFRHVFRNAYSFDLQWEKMSPLVLSCELTFAQIEAELDSFLSSVDSR